MTTMKPLTPDALMEAHAQAWRACPMHPTPAQIGDVLDTAVYAADEDQLLQCIQAALYDLWMYRGADLRHLRGSADDYCHCESIDRYRETGIRRLHRGLPCPGYHRDPVWLRLAYHGHGLTLAQIAARCGVSGVTVHRHMARHGIERRPVGVRAAGGEG